MTSYGLDEWFWAMFELTWIWTNFTFGQLFMWIVANSDQIRLPMGSYTKISDTIDILWVKFKTSPDIDILTVTNIMRRPRSMKHLPRKSHCCSTPVDSWEKYCPALHNSRVSLQPSIPSVATSLNVKETTTIQTNGNANWQLCSSWHTIQYKSKAIIGRAIGPLWRQPLVFDMGR